ncbi:hypothetical protein ABPG74_001990 [Tetrahymena malaccensis]
MCKQEEKIFNSQNCKYLKKTKSQTLSQVFHEEITQQVQEILDDPKYMNYTIDEISLNNFSTEYIEIISVLLNNSEEFKFKLEEQSYEKSILQNLIKLFFEKIAENQIESVKIIYEKIRMGFANYIQVSIINLSGSDLQYKMDFLISKTNLRNTKVSIKSSEMQSQVFSYILSLQENNKIFQISSLRLPIEQYQFNLTACKQIIQLNFELYSINGQDQFDLNNIINQIDSTQINKVQISCITFDYYNMKQIPKLTPFYKLKRLVSVNIKNTILEDGRKVDEKSFISFEKAFDLAIYNYIN